MTDFISRMKDEQTELSDRIEKLMVFISRNPIFLSTPPIARLLQEEQLEAMLSYNRLLTKRLEMHGEILGETIYAIDRAAIERRLMQK